jgi:uncharacterized membrane protein SpoIIM required for sporulation
MDLRSLLSFNLGLLIAAIIGLIFPLQTFWLAVLAVPILFVTCLLLAAAVLWRSANRTARTS